MLNSDPRNATRVNCGDVRGAMTIRGFREMAVRFFIEEFGAADAICSEASCGTEHAETSKGGGEIEETAGKT